MSKFKKDSGGSAPAISTASLPDIVFMLLFFFMVTTVMKEQDIIVDVSKPEASAVTKLQNKSLVDNVYIGIPVNAPAGSSPRIQTDDQLLNSAVQVQDFIKKKRPQRDPEDLDKVVTSLKVDKDTPMGIVTAVKQELRNVEALKINYSATPRREKSK